ncbi:hypothetical protein [Streptomyces sp. NPDC054854]
MVMALDMTAASELAVLRALERAGKRKVPRSERGRLNVVPPWEIYAHRPPVDPSDLDKALANAWDLPAAALLASGHAFTEMICSESWHASDRVRGTGRA